MDATDVEFLGAIRPLVEFLGGSIVAESAVGDLAIEREGRTIGHVRQGELHSALDRALDAIERELGSDLRAMTRDQKQIAVRLLDEQGVFLLRGAVEQVAKSMDVSRVTLYNYLNALERRS